MEEWKECKLGDICKTNINSYSEKDNWSFVNYLDTGNITENKISDIQFIDLSSESLPSRARRKVHLMTLFIQQFVLIRNILELLKINLKIFWYQQVLQYYILTKQLQIQILFFTI